MADKNVNIDINVQSQGIDNATQKVKGLTSAVKDAQTSTQEFGRGVQFVYDNTGKAINVLTDDTKRLSAQSRDLVNAMANLTAQGKTNTAEFTLLQKRHLELATTIEKTKATSKDLFGTLSLLPGSVGDFSGKLQGVVEITKLFGSLSLQGLYTQFKELGNIAGSVVKNVFSVFQKPAGAVSGPSATAGATPEIGAAAQMGAAAQTEAAAQKIESAAINQNTAEQNINAASRLKNASNTQEETIAINKNTTAAIENAQWYMDLSKEEQILVDRQNQLMGSAFDLGKSLAFIGNETISLDGKLRKLTATELELLYSNKELVLSDKGIIIANEQLNGSIDGNIIAQEELNVATEKTTLENEKLNKSLLESIASYARAGILARTFGLTLEGVSVGARAAQIAVAGLEAVLSAGIWVAIGIALQFLFEKIYKLGETMGWWGEQSKNATDEYTKALERNSEALNKNLNEIEFQTKKSTLLAQIAGKSAKDLLDITQDGLEKEKQLYSKQIGDLQAIRNKANADAKLKEEDKKKIVDDINKKIVDASTNYVKKRQEIELQGLEYTKQIAEQERKDAIDAAKTLLDYKNEFKKITAKNAREKEDIELDIQLEAERKKINAYKISEEKKKELLQQANANFIAQVLINNVKRNKEDEKSLEDEIARKQAFNEKLIEISIQGIQNLYAREDAERQKNREKEIEDIKKDEQFKKLSAERQAQVIADINKKHDNIDNDAKRQRKIDANNQEITLLQAQQKNLFEGTKEYTRNSLNIEELAYKTRLLNAEKTGESTEKITKEHEENKIQIERAAFIASKELTIARLEVIAGIGQNMQTLFGKQKGLAKAGVVIEKAASIGEIVANTGIANAKAVAASPLTFGMPWVAINDIAAALSIAATIKAGADAISQIDSTSSSSAGGTGTSPVQSMGKNYADGGMIEGPSHAQGGVNINAQGGEAVMNKQTVTMFKPLLSMMNQMGGGTSFARGAVGMASFDGPKFTEPAQTNVFKTYVVESELSSIQHKNARLKELSTI